MPIIPHVSESSSRGDRTWDIYSRLLRDRIIFIDSEIRPEMSGAIIAQLLYLESEDPEKPIHLYINSPGGYCTDGFAIIDTMNLIKAPVYTYCIGLSASMGALIFSQGEKGHRYITPNAEFMIHQPLGGAKGQCTDIQIQAENIQKIKQKTIKMLAEASGQKEEKVAADIERDYYMTAEETVAYGLADVVLEKK